MAAAFLVLVAKLQAEMTLNDAFTVAGGFEKLNAVDFSLDPDKRYTFWSGLLGGLFLALSYFGTDQSQVQRYISGGSLRESRLGLMFNAVWKIPMQFFILLLGVLLFVFYQFENRRSSSMRLPGKQPSARMPGANCEHSNGTLTRLIPRRKKRCAAGSRPKIVATLRLCLKRARRLWNHRLARKRFAPLPKRNSWSPLRKPKPVIPITSLSPLSCATCRTALSVFSLQVFFAATLSSKAAELNALGSTTTVDFYRHLLKREAADAHYVAASKFFTIFWGLVAISFALFANMMENLIEAVNILGSIFYGVVLAMFLVAFFVRRIGGTAIFWAAIVAQVLVLVLYATLSISYLWYNIIGCVACMLIAIVFQSLVGRNAETPTAETPTAETPTAETPTLP
jgi:uncharacterized sodium:solute symporter family permease YidK